MMEFLFSWEFFFILLQLTGIFLYGYSNRKMGYYQGCKFGYNKACGMIREIVNEKINEEIKKGNKFK
jgi:hypothetical protein